MNPSKTPAEWFRLAEHTYVAQHQGCAWCGGEHQVRMSQRGTKHVFNCQRCDFQITFDVQTKRYHLVPGEEINAAKETMLDQPVAHLL